MFSTKTIIAALSTFAVAFAAPAELTAAALPTLTAAVAAPAELAARNTEITPNVIVCSGSLHPANGCLTIPVGSDACINFTGGLSFLNKEASTASIDQGLVCSFFSAQGCISLTGSDVVVLTTGEWSFFNVQGASGPVNFNDKASSFSCSPI
ncbi:hypothetical protein BDQ12DRAFT_687559 [Crucibulum laeve]|uniref:Uncharacterized protein n=1 Tax=Crucibulum laeve TaxID=68775 RepID=A0A5C3LSN3_9AGAR|nr:hypothetical protein BDQ12DRAFT_694666 [Crucibulum laeve]TFK35791.1 hypothetical protein BDQ12DRAFT_687557 [Crucibulum laeve]TFK35792.1 hypothetical protein BDQ12DRAFT_687559 [Crucibulum laeve]